MAGELGDAQAQALCDEVLRRRQEEGAAYRIPHAAWRQRQDRIRNARRIAAIVFYLAFAAVLVRYFNP